MLTAKELRNKAGRAHEEAMAVVKAAAEKLSKEDEEKFDKLSKDVEDYIAQAEKIEKMEKLSIDDNEGKEVKPIVKSEFSAEEEIKAEGLAMKQYLSTGRVDSALHRFMKPAVGEKDDAKHFEAAAKSLGINLAQATSPGSAGGYTIPRGFVRELEKGLQSYGGMWEAARIIKTDSGAPLDWPMVMDTEEAYLIPENTQVTEVPITFGTKVLNAYKYTSGLVLISKETLEDTAFKPEIEIPSILVDRIWRGTNNVFTNGDGSNKPQGIVPAATYAGTGALDNDSLLSLLTSVDDAYARKPSARFMFNNTSLAAYMGLAVGTGDARPLWLPSISVGQPATLYGKPYTINYHMEDGIQLFGDFSKYIIRQVNNMRIVRLDERYADYDQVGFIVFFRVDGEYLNAGGDPIKKWRQAAT